MESPFSGVLRSDLEIAIFEANLGEKITFVVQKRFIDGLTLVEICGEFEDKFNLPVDRATVSRWLKYAEYLIKSALTRMRQKCT